MFRGLHTPIRFLAMHLCVMGCLFFSRACVCAGGWVGGGVRAVHFCCGRLCVYLTLFLD